MNPRALVWSVRRELWENRSIYLAPLAVIAFVLLAFLLSTISLPRRMRALPSLDTARQRHEVMQPYNVAAGLTAVTAFLVGIFYCLDALHGERRDRSILFWKSLPVSDRDTVLAKAAVPLVLLPLLSFAIIITAQLIMLLWSTVVLIVNGSSAAPLWGRLPLFQMTLALLYALPAMTLWYVPIYGWLLLVSAWARRATFIWAILPLLAIGAFEGMAFGSSRVGSFLKYRLAGWYTLSLDLYAPGADPNHPLTLLTPGRFLTTPGLWIGLMLGAAFLAGAVRLRRNREPI
jgi:ABC-2 type transport system permease protein